MTRHTYFRFPLNKDSSWRAFLYEFNERERTAFANESPSNAPLFREHVIWMRCRQAGHERYPGQFGNEAKLHVRRKRKEPRQPVVLVR